MKRVYFIGKLTSDCAYPTPYANTQQCMTQNERHIASTVRAISFRFLFVFIVCTKNYNDRKSEVSTIFLCMRTVMKAMLNKRPNPKRKKCSSS